VEGPGVTDRGDRWKRWWR